MNKYLILLILVTPSISYSKEDVKKTPKKHKAQRTIEFNCGAATSQAVLDINNVRTTLLNGGDMWWNLSNPKYEIPKNSGKHSLFAGSLWIGGLDDEDQLKVAAQTYRQSGNDFWPGPLNNVRLNSGGSLNDTYGATDLDICEQYDFHHVITRAEVLEFIAYSSSQNQSVDFPNYSIPPAILEYPGNRTTDNTNENAYQGPDDQVATNAFYSLETLAPFRDIDGDGRYNPLAGDYPEYNLDNTYDCQEKDLLFGDQTLWWVFNDNGGAHSASGSVAPIGLEIQAQAFAYATTTVDALDNSTFYNYTLINRSHNALNDAYFGVRVDPDLGNYQDDFVGCDVGRGLGYCYNGDDNDETAEGYGLNPPAIGVDFFRGPVADEGDGIDNDLDGIIDEIGEQIIMSKFVYFHNDVSYSGNPDIAQNFYNYLQGKWLDNRPITYGANGRDETSPLCNYMFPGDTDPSFLDPWTEQIAGNTPGDRRFLQSVGPFTFEPGAVKTITTGVVWSRAGSGGALASLEKLKLDDDYVQAIFDACFEIPCQTPDASLARFSMVTENYGLDMKYAFQFDYNFFNFNTEVVWDFDDGTTSANLMTVHYFEEPGDYLVHMTTSNDCGSSETDLEVHVPYLLNPNSILGVPIKRIEGLGSGEGTLELTDESFADIRTHFSKQIIEYKPNYGPFSVHIRDTSNVEFGDYELKVVNLDVTNFSWQIQQLSSGESYTFNNLEGVNEAYVFDDWGFDLQINQVESIGNNTANNGFNTAGKSSSTWLGHVKDEDNFFISSGSVFTHPANWIRSGTDQSANSYSGVAIDIGGLNDWEDPKEAFEGILNGMWAPYRLVAFDKTDVPFEHAASFKYGEPLEELNSIDIVYTDNQALWTRVPVIETGDFEYRGQLKTAPSVGKDGQDEVGGTTGFSWFPGYALNLEKGIRLNMMFGEASDLPDANGNDMIWNPTSTEYDGSPYDPETTVIFGGRHYVYVCSSEYAGENEEDHPQYTRLTNMSSNVNKIRVYREVLWVSIPLLAEGATLLDEEVKMKIRVFKPFNTYAFEIEQNDGLPLYQFSINVDYSSLNAPEMETSKTKKLVKIVNFIGQEVLLDNINIDMPYIEIYDDGSAIKKFKID